MQRLVHSRGGLPLTALCCTAAASSAVLAAVFIFRLTVRKKLLHAIRPGQSVKPKLRDRMVPGVNGALYSAGIRMDSRNFISLWLMCIALAASAGVVAGLPAAACMLLTSGACALPCAAVSVKRKARIRKFESQLADAVSVLAGALRTGYSFQGALKSVCSCSPSPLRDEFEIVSYETSLGVPLGESLDNLLKRVPGRDLKMLCTAVSVQSSIGGDLTEILSNLSSTIRARSKIRREIRSKTAGGRLSGLIVALLPFVLFLALKLMSPGYIDPFISSPEGRAALAAGSALMAAGFLLIRKIVNIEY